MAKYSQSGLFEVWGGQVIEGDMVTPTCLRFMRLGIYDTSEAIEAATASNEFWGWEYLEVRAPKAYTDRHAEISRRQAVRERLAALEDISVPF